MSNIRCRNNNIALAFYTTVLRDFKTNGVFTLSNLISISVVRLTRSIALNSRAISIVENYTIVIPTCSLSFLSYTEEALVRTSACEVNRSNKLLCVPVDSYIFAPT